MMKGISRSLALLVALASVLTATAAAEEICFDTLIIVQHQPVELVCSGTTLYSTFIDTITEHRIPYYSTDKQELDGTSPVTPATKFIVTGPSQSLSTGASSEAFLPTSKIPNTFSSSISTQASSTGSGSSHGPIPSSSSGSKNSIPTSPLIPTSSSAVSSSSNGSKISTSTSTAAITASTDTASSPASTSASTPSSTTSNSDGSATTTPTDSTTSTDTETSALSTPSSTSALSTSSTSSLQHRRGESNQPFYFISYFDRLEIFYNIFRGPTDNLYASPTSLYGHFFYNYKSFFDYNPFFNHDPFFNHNNFFNYDHVFSYDFFFDFDFDFFFAYDLFFNYNFFHSSDNLIDNKLLNNQLIIQFKPIQNYFYNDFSHSYKFTLARVPYM